MLAALWIIVRKSKRILHRSPPARTRCRSAASWYVGARRRSVQASNSRAGQSRYGQRRDFHRRDRVRPIPGTGRRTITPQRGDLRDRQVDEDDAALEHFRTQRYMRRQHHEQPGHAAPVRRIERSSRPSTIHRAPYLPAASSLSSVSNRTAPNRSLRLGIAADRERQHDHRCTWVCSDEPRAPRDGCPGRRR